jgi:hypothetical protein
MITHDTRLWFFEGMDATGKTTAVRELQRMSRYAINGLIDRGPVSRIVWGRFAGHPRGTWIHWREWFKHAGRYVGIVLFMEDVEVVWKRLCEEMEGERYAGYPWDRSSVLTVMSMYVEEVDRLRNGVTKVVLADMDSMARSRGDGLRDYVGAYRSLARMIGYGHVPLNASADAFTLGDRDESKQKGATGTEEA